MNNWISALAHLQTSGEPCVLVTIIEELGSTPRNAGSKMVISAMSLSEVSEIAMVTDSECRMPTLMVSAAGTRPARSCISSTAL